MRLPIWLTIIVASLVALLVFAIGTFFLRPPTALIVSAAFDDETITPNADGADDVTTLRFDLARNAVVSILFQDQAGNRFTYRDQKPTLAGQYNVLFSGVVDGYVLPDEALSVTVAEDSDPIVERRLIPNGTYQWYIIAQNETEREEAQGTLTIADADVDLPLISSFTLSTDVFTPNRDGISDRVIINIFLEKEANLDVFLLDQDDNQLPISQRQEWSCQQGDDCGRYTFDYEGGVDLNQTPPPDGTYRVVALAQDAEGQRIRREATLAIAQGGVPRAEISSQANVDVFWTTLPYDERFFSDSAALGDLIPLPEIGDIAAQTSITVPYGDLLVFRLTVDNYSDIPIRTTQPPVGAVYQQNQVSASLNALEEPGAWRVALDCDSSERTFPYRWAVAAPDDLETIFDVTRGRAFDYLPAHTSTVVWGAVRLTDIDEYLNPQTCWVGLIHEGVNISVENRFVGPIEVLIAESETVSIDDN